MADNVPVAARSLPDDVLNGGTAMSSRRMLGVTTALLVAIGAVSAWTAAVAEPLPGPAVESSAGGGASAFRVSYDGKSFAASLPPSSIATYTWTPGSSAVGVTETETSGGSLVKGAELAVQPRLSFTAPSGSLPTVRVTPTISMQRIAGFGGAMTQSAAALITRSTSEKKIMAALFGSAGADFNLVRVPMGASDFVTGPIYSGGYSYDDNGGRADPALARFSIGTRSAKGAKQTDCAPASSAAE